MLTVKKHSSTLLKILIISLGCLSGTQIKAKEGLWNPANIRKQEEEMRALGLEIPIENLYNDSGTALNNSVVFFGRGCTAGLVSGSGLLITNRHCAYGSVAALTALNNDYLNNGFFAKNREEEIPCTGLTVSFVRSMENVTNKLLPMVPDTLHDHQRDSIIAGRIEGLEREYEMRTGLEATVKPMFDGNQYWMILTETFRDVRLVGFPHKGIGGFGGDLENWSWPSHTGDFSLFRIYAGPDNKPASYNKANVPYASNAFLKIQTKGYKEGDFTMVYGFPGTTNEYISSYELNQLYTITYPISIEARTKKLEVWNKHMGASKKVAEQYSSKRSGLDGGRKKWAGEMQGLKADSVVLRKRAYEAGFQKWATNNIEDPYAEPILPHLEAAAKAADVALLHEQYIRETVLGVELIQQGSTMDRFMACFRANLPESKLRDTLAQLANGMNWFYKNYDKATDKDVFQALLPMYIKKFGTDTPPYYQEQYKKHGKDIHKWANYLYDSSVLTSQERLLNFAAKATHADSNTLLRDPAWLLYSAIAAPRKQSLAPVLENYREQKRYWNRLYLKARMSYEYGTPYYPDANLTLRISFGQVKGLKPEKSTTYSYHTQLGEIIKLHDPKSDFYVVPTKLKDLYQKKDFGRWAQHDTLFTTFIADNHTSGGNSGSPVLNKRGELIGLNYDRAWEGTMSDLYFDPARSRNISVDIRYILFVIEKFAGAGWLIDELKLVE